MPTEPEERIHIVHCAAFAAPYPGSFVPMLVAAAQEAASRGHTTSICLPSTAGDRPWLGQIQARADVRLVPLPATKAALVRPLLAELAGLIPPHSSPAAIHTHFTEYDIPAALMRLRRSRLAVFWHEHSVLSQDPKVRLRNRLRFTLLGPLVDRVLGVSPELVRGLGERGVPAAKLIEFPNAIDTGRFAPPTAAERLAARTALGIAPEARVALHFGWNWGLKGGEVLLGAAERLADEQPQALLLTVLGEPPEAAVAASISQHPNVRVLAPVQDARALFAAADVFVSASRAEGGAPPLAVLEALSSGLPIVLSDIPAHRGEIEALPGVILAERVPGAMADAIRCLLELSQDERAQHAEMASRWVVARFSLSAWAARLVDLYELVLRGRAPTHRASRTSRASSGRP